MVSAMAMVPATELASLLFSSSSSCSFSGAGAAEGVGEDISAAVDFCPSSWERWWAAASAAAAAGAVAEVVAASAAVSAAAAVAAAAPAAVGNLPQRQTQQCPGLLRGIAVSSPPSA